MAFLSKYRILRNDQEDLDEVEFNFGRAFHQLGEPGRFMCMSLQGLISLCQVFIHLL